LQILHETVCFFVSLALYSNSGLIHALLILGSDKLSLKVTSSDTATSSSTPPPDSLPVPVYSDANVNVYSFTSTSHSAPVAPVPTSSLKRKRSSSPSSPTRPHSPPRSNSPMENQPSRSSRSPSPSRLDPSSPSFQPSKLTGAAASAWRSAVLRDMFRGSAFDTSNPLTPTQTVPSSNETGTNKERRGPTPAYLPQSLPSFSAPTEAMSYLVVGPAQSGKFLPGEAVKRGVNPGKSFSRLKNGERVWVRTMTEEEKTRQGMNGSVISGAKGTKETKKERAKRLKEEKMAQEEADSALEEGVGEGNWVKPEDCMGPGQDASVSLRSKVSCLVKLDADPSDKLAGVSDPQYTFAGLLDISIDYSTALPSLERFSRPFDCTSNGLLPSGSSCGRSSTIPALSLFSPCRPLDRRSFQDVICGLYQSRSRRDHFRSFCTSQSTPIQTRRQHFQRPSLLLRRPFETLVITRDLDSSQQYALHFD